MGWEVNDTTRSPIGIAGDWPMIEAQLPSDWRTLAQQHGLVPKNVAPQLGAKVTDVSVPLRMVLHHVGTNTSLRTTTAMAATSGLLNISPVALHKWMRRFGPFLAALLAALTDAAKKFAACC
jgi:transposase-like protein